MSACAVDDDKLQPATRDTVDTVWVSMDSDAGDIVRDAVALGTIEGSFHAEEGPGSIMLFEIPRDQIAKLTHIMHETSHHCGGYIAHESYERALAALDNKRARDAVHRRLVSYSIDNGDAIAELSPALDQKNLIAIIEHLSTQYINRYHTTPHGTDAAMWIERTWQRYIDAAGRTDATVELYLHSNTNQPSVILTIEGDAVPDEVVVIGAHLDSTAGFGTGPSTPAPGADDDASGVATASEVARVLLTEGFRPDRTVKFMAYAAEEVGLVGSGEIANDFLAQGIDVVGVMQLDMTNYQGSAPDIVLMDDYTNAAQNQFVGDLIDTYLGLNWTYSTCGYGCSDHASWTNAGFVASIPFESLMGQYNPTIHSAYDTLQNSDADGYHAMKFAELALVYVAELAKGDFTDDAPSLGQTTVEVYSDVLGDDETRSYGPFPVVPNSTFDAQLTFDRDAELYVRFGAQPTTTEYDCRPAADGSEKRCTQVVPGTESEAYVMVRGTRAAYTLTVTYADNTPPPAPITENFSGSVAQGQSHHFGPFTVSPGSAFVAAMSGSGDADLYVRFGAPPTQTDWDCRPYTGNTNETCTRAVPAGETQAYVMVYGYASANYNLAVTYLP